MSEALPSPTEMLPASVYIHFPYCLQKCPYCDFVSYRMDRPQVPHEPYADAVIRELEVRAEGLDALWRRPSVLPPRSVQTVFFGGGTPSLWAPSALGRVLAAVKATLPCAPDMEVTVECNPTSLTEEGGRALHEVGVNRLSVGTQSLREDQLRFLGRLHDADGALRALRDALASGVPRVSTDMIFGLPDQTPEDARLQAATLAAAGLRHLSCYQLTIEPGTVFGDLARKGRLPLADDGLVSESFLAIDAELTGRGFCHYEISNYAMPGEQSRHNMAYWKGHEYLGLGCGAYGFLRDGTHRGHGLRYRNEVDPEVYQKSTHSLVKGTFGVGDGLSLTSENLGPDALLRERIMLGLRLEEGFDLQKAGEDLGIDPLPPSRVRAMERLVERGRLEQRGSRLRIPRPYWLWADDTAARLF